MKNFRSFLCNSITLLMSILFLIFMSQPHFGYAIGSKVSWANGYQLINFSSNDGKQTALAVGLLLATIFACLLILTSIYGLLRCFNVVKTNNYDKLVRWLNIGISTLFVVFMSLAFIMDICIVGEYNSKIQTDLTGEKVGWGLVINFVLSIVSLVAVCFNKLPKKTTKKS